LDILLKDGFSSSAYGYKLVIAATKKVFDEHVQHHLSLILLLH